MFLISLECSRSFLSVPDNSKMFQIIQECSRSFINVPYYSKMFQIILEYPRLFWKYPRSFKNIPDHSKMYKVNPNSFNLVFYQHALQLCICLLLGLLCSSRRVTGLGLIENFFLNHYLRQPAFFS